MSTTLRSPIALAGLVVILSQTGCLTTSKFKGPQWLSFNRGDAGVDASGLPDPSTLATPTTVTPVVTEPNVTLPGDAPQVAQNSAAPAPSAGSSTTTHPAITNVAPASYPSTNQPAPTQLAGNPSAGFLPQPGAPPADVQQGPYEQPPAAPPQPVANAVAQVPVGQTPPQGGMSTWDQPAQIPYPSGNSTPDQPRPNAGSIYGGGPAGSPTASTTPPQNFTPPPAGSYPSAGTAANSPPPSQPIAPVGYDEPASHYERTAQNTQSGGSGWRPGSTTSLAPTVR